MDYINRIKRLFKESKIFNNILTLFKGNVVVSIVGLINTALLISALGIDNNGIIFMAQSYAMLFNSLFNFQSYSAVVRFVPRVMNDSKEKIIIYLKQGFFLDFTTALLGMFMAFVLLEPISKLMKWDETIVKCMAIYIIIILFSTTGTMAGILRIYDKFKEAVYINLVEVLSKFILFIIGFKLKQGIYYFLIVEIISVALAMLAFMWFSYKTIREQNLHFKNIKWKIDKEFFKFNLYSNLETAADLPLQYITPFIINAMLGLSDITIYKVIEKVGALIYKVTFPISQAIFPDLSKRIAQNNLQAALGLHKKAKKIIFVLGSIIVIGATITAPLWLGILIPVTFKNVLAMSIYLAFVVFTNMFIALHSIFNLLGYIKKNIPIILFANIIYLVILFKFTGMFGVIGVILSKIIQSVIVISSKEIILRKNNYREVKI